MRERRGGEVLRERRGGEGEGELLATAAGAHGIAEPEAD